MRRFILIAAIVLTSASAWADQPRGLSLASNNETQAAAQPGATEPSKAETAKVETPKDDASKAAPAGNEAASQPSKADQVTPDHARPAAAKTEKPKARRDTTEARVINELHRHGIYW
jgi:hypothetical protein